MTPARDFIVAARLALVTTLATFALIVIGSVVRTTGSGLACPDWPLCEGRVIPRFEAHVLIEWTHRTVALLVSLCLLATTAWILTHRAPRARLGGLVLLSVGMIFVQILLGALTVWKLLHPAVVSSHLAVGLLLFVTLLTLTLAASEAGESPGTEARPERPPGLLPLLGSVAFLTYAQAVLGGMVSTSHAGLACPDWPECNGEWLPAMRGLVGLQMAHRYGAYLLLGFVVLAAARARHAPDPGIRLGAMLALTLTFAQIVLGVCNVFLGTPPWLSAAHLATASTLIGLWVVVTHRAAMLPARTMTWAPATS